MSILFEPIYTPGIAQISYMVGDSKAAVVAVIDPRRDVDVYLDLARERGVRIAVVIETHIHADFVSGVHELAARTGARIVGGCSKDYAFDLAQSDDGASFELGTVTLTVLHTPGHTPEHICLLLKESQQGVQPFAALTGDTLFNLDVGRPDLVGSGTARGLAAQLRRSLFDKLVPLGDRMEVYPCHGAGSACGKSIGDRRQSTIGNERLFNDALDASRDEAAFVDWLLKDMPPAPLHYARLKKLNAVGAPLLGGAPSPRPMAPKAFASLPSEAQVIDVRSILAFGGGHVPGALNIALRDEFPTWAGSMIEHRSSWSARTRRRSTRRRCSSIASASTASRATWPTG
jgi:hydroxyacylglutathione hydrolase